MAQKLHKAWHFADQNILQPTMQRSSDATIVTLQGFDCFKCFHWGTLSEFIESTKSGLIFEGQTEKAGRERVQGAPFLRRTS